MKNKPLNSRLIEDKVSQFDVMVLDLASSLTKGYQEVKDKFGEDAPSPEEYYEKVRGKFFELLDK